MNALRRYKQTINSILVTLLAVWQIGRTLQAATVYWDINGSTAGAGGATPSDTWNAGNSFWNSLLDGTGTTAAWTAGDIAVFSAGSDATGSYGITVDGTQSIGGFVFRSGNASLTGGTLNLATPATIDLASGLSASVASLLTGTAGLSKTGLGTLTLSGPNTGFSGPVTLRGGITSIGAADNLGDGSPTNTLTLAGGTLQANNTFSLGANRGPIIGLGDGVIDVTGSNILTADGTVSVAPGLIGRAILTKTGTGTLTLSGTNNTSIHATTVNGGILSIASNTNLGTGRLTLNSGVLEFTGTSATMTNGISLGLAGGTVNVTTSGQTLTAGTLAIIGPGSLTKTGAGTLQLNVASTYAGSTTISQGTLAGGVASFLPARTQLSVASGATLNMNAFATTVASLSGAGIVTNTGAAAALTLGNVLGNVDSTFSGTFTANTAANLTLSKNGGGTLTLTNSGTAGNATGAWTLTAGTVKLDYANAGSQIGNIINGSIAPTFAGGTLNVTGRSGATVAQALGNVTLSAGGSKIQMVPNAGTSTTLTLGTLPVSGAVATTVGGALLIEAPTDTAVRITTTDVANGTYGGRIVFSDGTNFNWANNGGGGSPRTVTGFTGYTALAGSGNVAATNYLQTDTLVGGLTASEAVNSLKITTTTAGQNLDVNGNVLTLTNGGLLFTGAHNFEILTTGGSGSLRSGTATNSDFIVQQYGAGVLTISAPIVASTGTSTLTKAGVGTLVLNAANTYTGGTFIGGGVLSVSNNNQLGATATAAIAISDGATFRTTADVNTGTHTYSLTGGNATFDIANATTLTVGGVISGAGGLTLNNTGTLQVNAAATYTGPTFIGAGATLKGGIASFLGATAGGTLTVANGGLVDMNGFILSVGAIAGSGTITNTGATQTLSFGTTTNTTSANQHTTFSGTLSGALNIGKNGGGTLTLTNAATYVGTTGVTNGGIIFGVNNALPIGALTIGNNAGPVTAFVDMNGFNWTSGAITFYGTSGGVTSQGSLNIGDGGVLTLGGTVTMTNNTTAANSALPAFITGGTIELSATRSFAIADSPNAAVDLTVTSVIASTAGAFGITKGGAGTLLLTGANTYTGTTTVNGAGGVLALGGAGTLGATTNALTMTAGILDLNGTKQGVGAFSGVAAGTVRNSAAGTLSTLTTGNGTLITSSLSYAGTFIDGGGTLALTKNGAGILTLTGANTYTGGTQVNDGILVFGNTSAQPASGTTQVASIAALGLGVGGAGFYTLADVDSLFANTLTNVNLANGASVGIDTTAGDFDYTTSQSAARGLVKLGTNVLTLSGTNTYTGGTLIAAGTLAVSADSNLGAVASALTIVNGGALRVTGTSFSAWNASRTLTLAGAATIDIADAANTLDVGINLTPGGALTKVGAGTLNLSGTVTGGANGINVNGGVLQIDGSLTTTGTTAVGNAASTQGLLRVPTGGTFSTANLNLGNNATGAGALVVNGGTATVTNGGTGVGLFLGNGGYGGLFVTPGSILNTGRVETSTSTATTAFAVIHQTGGTLNNSEWFLMRNNRFDAVITSGTLDRTGASQNLALAYQGAATSFGDFTVAGGLVINTGRNVTFGQVNSAAALGTGVLNLNAGTLRTNQILAYNPVGAATTALINFNGGTLQAATATTDFIGFNGSGGSSALTLRSYGAFGSYAGGAVIDTNGFAVTLAQPIVAPTGNGVSTIPVTSGGSGYFGAPYVEISGDGTGATAYATVDLDPSSATYGQVTGITVTSPGVGYTSAPTITLSGGGGTGATLGTVTTATNTSGGLTKTGNGTLTLTAANTFTGATTANGGTLSILPTALPNTSALIVGSTGNATFDLYADGVGAALNMALNANLILGSAANSGSFGFQLGTASDSIVLSGTGALTVNVGGGIINAQALAGFGAGTYDLITGPNNIVGGANLSLGSLPGGFTYSFDYTTDPTKLALLVGTAAAGNLFWTGDVNGSWAQGGANTNWSTLADGSVDSGFTPASTNTVIFSATNASTSPISTTLDNAISIQGLKITNSLNGVTPTGAVTIAAGTGGTLTIGTDGIEVQAGAPASTTISAPVALGAAQTWTVADLASTLTMSGGLSGDFNLIKAGAGQLTITTNATRTAAAGTTTLMTGTLRVESLSGLSAGSGIGMNLNGGTLSLARDVVGTFNGVNSTLGGSATIEVDRLTPGAGVTLTVGTLSIGAHTLTVTGGANATSGNMQFTTGAATLTGNAVFNVTNSGLGATTVLSLPSLTESPATSGFGFTKNGDGTLILTGAGSYTGVVTLNAGILRTSFDGTTGLGIGTASLVLNGGELQLFNSTARNYARPTTVAGDVTITLNRNSVGAAVTHTLGALAMGGQTLTLGSGTNPTSGNMGLTFGATTLGGSPTFDVSNNGLGATTVLTLGALNDGGVARTITKSGNGTMVLGTAATSLVDGTLVNIDGGRLNATNVIALGTQANVTIASSAIFGPTVSQTLGALNGAGTVTLTAGQTLTVGSTNNLNSNFSGVFTATTGGLTKVRNGTMTLTGQNLYTGATTINGGTLVLDFASSSLVADIISASSPLVMGGGNLSVIGDPLATSQTFASTMLTANTFSQINATAGAGGLTLSLGTLTRGAISALNFSLTNSPTVQSAGSITTNGVITDAKGVAFVTLNNTDWANLSGSNVVAASYAANDFSSLANNVDVTAPGNWTGTPVNTLRFNTGTPTLTLTGANTLSAGGLMVGTGAGAVTVSGAGTLAGSPVTGTVASPVVGELGIFQNSASTLTISAAIVNNATSLSHLLATPSGTVLNKYGTGTLVLSSTQNAYTGGTNITDGTLRLGASEVIPDGAAQPGAVTISAPATLDLNGFSETINGLAGAGAVDNTSATAVTLTVGNRDETSAFSGTINQSGGGVVSLTKTGNGTLTLSGANTYTGATTISGGSNTTGLTLNFTAVGAPTSNIISASSALNLGSALLTITGSTVANSQTFNGTTLSGGGRITIGGTTPALTLNLGAITRAAGSGGTVNFTIPGTSAITTTNLNDATGILGAWAVVGSADFATVTGGNIGAYTGYIAISGVTGVGNTSHNALFQAGNSINAATVDYNTVKLAAAPSFAAAGNILRLGATGAILMPTGLAATTIGSAAGNGVLTAGGAANTAGELNLINWSANTLTINSAIANNGTGAVSVVKSGSGQVTFATANTFTGGLIINQGIVSVSAANQVPGAVTLNGGTLSTATNSFSLTSMALSLGAGGGTLNITTALAGNGTFGAAATIGTPGTGPRVLTVTGGTDNRFVLLPSNFVDGTGGATGIVMSLGGDAGRVLRLSGTNTYTGTTTLARGVLDFSAVVQVPGGITSGATIGNILFAATGTSRAILQSSVATPVSLTRSIGYGDGQIHWEGNGGFSNNIANTTWAVNLGGAGQELVWGQGGFVPAGSRLQFGVASITNSVTNLGGVNFQNGIDFGDQIRIIESFSANNKLGSNPFDVILSGDLVSSAGGGFEKVGFGVMILTGNNNVSTDTNVTLTAGGLVFGSAAAIPGSGANLTLPTTAGGNSFIGLVGDINPISSLGSRIANPLTATSAFTIGADSSANLDFTSYPNMRLAAYVFGFNATSKAISYTGTITPANSTYLFGGAPYAGNATNTIMSTLVLPGNNTLTGGNALNMTFGNLTITGVNNFSGGTTLSGNGIGNAVMAVGSNAALGTGTVTLTGSSTQVFGAVNGDQYLANNIAWAGSATSFVAAGDTANDGISSTNNGGGITYLGSITITNSAGAPTIISRTGHQVLILGEVSNGLLTSGVTYSASTAGLISSLATPANGGTAKTYNGNSIINSTTTLVIDADSALGSGGNISLGGGGSAGNTATLRLQPGTGAVTLASSRTVSLSADRNFELRVGTGGTLTIAGVLNAQGTNTAVRNLNKTDAGTLVFTNKNNYTGAATFSPTLGIRAGTLQLDSSTGNFTAATDRFFPDSTNPLPLAFSSGSGTFAGGGTLEIIQGSGNDFALTQGFGNPAFNTGGSTIKLTNNSATQGLTLNLGATFARTALLGATVNFVTTTAGGTNTIGSTVANNAGGIIAGYATFNGVDWATQSAGAIVALGSYTSPLPGSGATAAANYVQTATGTTTITANQTVNSLKLAPADSTLQTISINTSVTQTVTSGGLLFDNSNGSATITGAGQYGATGAEVIVHTWGSGDITANKLTLNGVIKGAATVISKSGPGTLVLSGNNTYTGALIINAGVLEYANGGASGQNLGSPTAGAGNIVLNGGVLRQTASNNLIYGMTVNGYAAVDVPAGVVMSHTAQGITGKAGVTGILQKTGVGALGLHGTTDNSFLSLEVLGGSVNLSKTSSATVHSVGVSTGSTAATSVGAALIIGNGARADITSSGSGNDQIHDQSSVVVRGGGIFGLGGGSATAESFDSLAGTGSVTNYILNSTFNLTLGAGNNVNVSAYSVAAAEAGVAATGLNNFGGVISDGGVGGAIALTKIGGGTQILSGLNTYSGATNINAGILQLGIANALPSGAGKGNVNIIGNGYGAGTINGGTSIGTADKILAPGTLDMGGFNQNINGLNSTTGGFVVNNPTLSWNGSAWVAANSTNTLTVGNGDANGSFNGRLIDGYTVAPGAVTATSYVGILGLIKVGAGTQTLSGENTYTGGTTVTAGTLLAVNTTGSATGSGSVNVSAAGILGGTGSIIAGTNNNITIDGTLDAGIPAASSGTALALTVGGTGSLAFNGTTQFQLFNNDSGINSTEADWVVVNAPDWSNLIFGGSSILNITTGLTATSFVAGDSWKLFDWVNVAAGSVPVQGTNGFNSIVAPTLDVDLEWDYSALFTAGTISVIVVPEPSRMLLLLVGLFGVCLRRRRK